MHRRGLVSIAAVLLLAACGGESRDAGHAPEAGGSGGLEPGGGGGTGAEGGTGGGGGTLDPDAPRIDEVVPDAGLVGTVVELHGARLAANRELVVLFRPGVSGRLLAVDRGGAWIRTVVPAGAITGPVNLRLDGANVSGPSFTVDEGYPVPRVERVVPDYVRAGTAWATVRLEGWGFDAASRLTLDDVTLEPTSRTANTLEVALPASLLADEGRRWFRVTNPTPGGGASEAVAFQVSGPFNLLQAIPESSTSVKLVFDRPPDPVKALDPGLYRFDCYT